MKTGSDLESKRVLINNSIIYLNDKCERGSELFKIHEMAFNSLSQELIMLYEEMTHPGKIFGEVFQSRFNNLTYLKNKSNKGVIMELQRDDIPS